MAVKIISLINHKSYKAGQGGLIQDTMLCYVMLCYVMLLCWQYLIGGHKVKMLLCWQYLMEGYYVMMLAVPDGGMLCYCAGNT